MRRLVALAVVAVAAPTGCYTTYVNVPIDRQDQLLGRSEDVRQVGPMHPWQGDQEKPDEHLAPVRIHGSVQ